MIYSGGRVLLFCQSGFPEMFTFVLLIFQIAPRAVTWIVSLASASCVQRGHTRTELGNTTAENVRVIMMSQFQVNILLYFSWCDCEIFLLQIQIIQCSMLRSN
jgi:hypothetical protein